MSTHAWHLHLHESVLQQIPSEGLLCTHPRMPPDCLSSVREICSCFPASCTFYTGLILESCSQDAQRGEKREKKDETAQKKKILLTKGMRGCPHDTSEFISNSRARHEITKGKKKSSRFNRTWELG